MEIYFEISEYFEIYFILFEINENLLLKSDIKSSMIKWMK